MQASLAFDNMEGVYRNNDYLGSELKSNFEQPTMMDS